MSPQNKNGSKIAQPDDQFEKSGAVVLFWRLPGIHILAAQMPPSGADLIQRREGTP